MADLNGQLMEVSAEALDVLRRHVVEPMFPRIVDARGGFHEHWGLDWGRLEGDSRSVVFQSRAVWVASVAAGVFPDLRRDLHSAALHGMVWLRDFQWDKELGGFWWETDAEGRPTEKSQVEKHSYGAAFAIYALAEMAKAFDDPDAQNLAVRTFLWLDHYAHDAVNKGYVDCVKADGSAFVDIGQPEVADRLSFVDVARGYRSLNTQMHILEALSSLTEAWEEPQVEQRLGEMLRILKEKMFVLPGCMGSAFTADWRSVPSHDSYGHDVEAAFLMIEAAGLSDDPDPLDTAEKARNIVDHALDVGYDRIFGGLYAEGDAFGQLYQREKVWWVQAELLNALAVMHSLFGVQTDHYGEALLHTWDFVKRSMLDEENRGWRAVVSESGEDRSRVKMDSWTEGYHQSRALVNMARFLGSREEE